MCSRVLVNWVTRSEKLIILVQFSTEQVRMSHIYIERETERERETE